LGEPLVSSWLPGGISKKNWLQFENIGKKSSEKNFKIFIGEKMEAKLDLVFGKSIQCGN